MFYSQFKYWLIHLSAYYQQKIQFNIIIQNNQQMYQIPDTTEDKLANQIISQRLSMVYELRIPIRLFHVVKPAEPKDKDCRQKLQKFGYKCYSYRMYSQYKCPYKESHVWTSDVGYCEIYFKFQNLKAVEKPLEIPFFIQLYGQICKKCPNQKKTFVSMQYDSQVRYSFEKAARSFLNFLVRIMLGVDRPRDQQGSTKRDVLVGHNIHLCQACKLGKCRVNKKQ